MKELFLIADYCSDTLAVGEVLLAIRRATATPFTFQTVVSRPFNTIHTGFLLDQLQRGLSDEQAKRTVFFLNTDPRAHTKGTIHNAEGAPFIAAFLRNGAVAVGANAGHCFSFVKPQVREAALLRAANGGSQFRSRDTFPPLVAKALAGRIRNAVLQPLSLGRIPAPPKEHVVFHCDNYGNVKTSYTKTDFDKAGISWNEACVVAVEGREQCVARIAPNIFGGAPGALVFAPGSSGDSANPYFEFSVRFNDELHQSAAAFLGWPEPGTRFTTARQRAPKLTRK